MNITIYQFLSLLWMFIIFSAKNCAGSVAQFQSGIYAVVGIRHKHRKIQRERETRHGGRNHSDKRNMERNLFLVFQILEVILTNRG